MAKEELKLRGIVYDYIDLEDIGKTAKEVTGRNVKTVPQIYIEGEYVGGYDELMTYLDANSDTDDGEECKACEG
jgi:glutaredoxin